MPFGPTLSCRPVEVLDRAHGVNANQVFACPRYTAPLHHVFPGLDAALNLDECSVAAEFGRRAALEGGTYRPRRSGPKTGTCLPRQGDEMPQ
jgi:hypothetical protein